jgi:hypothetical protein
MPKNKLLIPFIILLTANLIGGGYWLSRRINIADFIPSQTKIDFAKEFPEQPKANYYGWIGADRINLTVNYDVATFVGRFEDKNKNNFELFMINETSPTDKSLKWNVNKLGEKKKLGTLEVFALSPSDTRLNLSYALTLFDTQVLHGVYQPKDGLPEDVYLTQDQQKVENWTSKPLKGKVYKGKNTERPTYFIDMGSDNGQFFTFETWWLNEFKDGDEIIFNGKIREYNDVQKSGGIETNKGIFDIKSVNKI